MKKNEPDDNLAMYDTAVIVLAGTLGSLGATATQSPGVGALATGVLAAAGLGMMRIDSIRDKTKEAALLLTKSTSTRTPDHSGSKK